MTQPTSKKDSWISDLSDSKLYGLLLDVLNLSPLKDEAKEVFSTTTATPKYEKFAPTSCMCSVKYTAADYLPEINTKFYKFYITYSLMVF